MYRGKIAALTLNKVLVDFIIFTMQLAEHLFNYELTR